VKERGGELSRLAVSFPYVGLIGVPLVLLVTALLAERWAKMLGIALAAPLALFLAVGGLALALTHACYFGILGAGSEPARSQERQGYDALRQNLATGGFAVRLYSRWLTAFLDAVDRFFGDAGVADRTLFPHAFGLRTPAPLWTAPAFDRCLLLASIYPIVTILMIWAISGHVGKAEAALFLKPDYAAWQRGLVLAGSVSLFIAGAGLQRVKGWKRLVFWVMGIGGFIPAAFEDYGIYTVGSFLSMALGIALNITYTGAGTYAVCGLGSLLSIQLGFALFGFAGFSAAAALNWMAIRYQRQGVFLSVFLVAMIVGCLSAAPLAPSRPAYYMPGPLLLFFGLLTLLNAPFNWASLGLTRALLRRGLELQSWWPFLLGLVDALFAAVIVALLALTMVIGVQTFDALGVQGGGKAVLPLGALFDDISAHPEAPEYWWVYALLLSTMIPSLVNLVIGGTALMRAVPGLSPFVLGYLPATGAVRSYDRAWIAAVLTGQVALGVILGVGVQALLAYGLIFYAMPAVGPGLLDIARDFADLELPTRLIQLLAGAS
jgi:hypothetical protein